MIVGIDEVGRGAWAGPLVVGAVLLDGDSIAGLTDSKKLTKRQRERLDLEIRQKAAAIGLGWVSARQVDTMGLAMALRVAAKKALSQIRLEYQEVIVDGTVALVDGPRVTTMAKADLLIPSVSAASIVAKVARDRYMGQLDGIFSGYKFASHVGYGTAAHRAALEAGGATPLHRLSFEPLSPYRKSEKDRRTFSQEGPQTSSKAIGDEAEAATAEHLRQKGHRILNRNWRTKQCEIDIVSRRGERIYFTEVKYRKNDTRGGGLAAITATKLRQMRFAAEYYLHVHQLRDVDAVLTVADVTGSPPAIKGFLELG